MEMFVSNVPCVDVEFFPLRDVLEHSLQFLFDVCILQYCSAVFGTPDDVIVTDPRCVGLLVQASVHGSVTLVSNIDHRDCLKDFVIKRTPRLRRGFILLVKRPSLNATRGLSYTTVHKQSRYSTHSSQVRGIPCLRAIPVRRHIWGSRSQLPYA